MSSAEALRAFSSSLTVSSVIGLSLRVFGDVEIPQFHEYNRNIQLAGASAKILLYVLFKVLWT